MNICVIENNAVHNERLVLLLREVFPKARVWPKYDQPCRSWKAAMALVARMPVQAECIVFADLALEGEDVSDAEAGVRQCIRIRRGHPRAILIAVTNYRGAAEDCRDAAGVFDAVVSKQDPEWKNDVDIRRRVKETVEEVRRRRSGAPAPSASVEIRDSLGMRLLDASIGRENITELARMTTDGWRNVAANTLSSGFSGSQLLQLTGESNGQPAQLILKVATRRSILDDEAKRPKECAKHLHQFAGHINSSLEDVKQLGQQRVYYLVQAVVAGETLYNVLKSARWPTAKRALSSLLSILIRQYSHAIEHSGISDRSAVELYGLTAIQRHWLLDSCIRLVGVGQTLEKEKQWPSGVEAPTVVFSGLRKLATKWERLVASVEVPCWAVQHGDLHPGNVLVQGSQLTFIDLARLGRWPIGYDVSRLAAQARIRLVDHEEQRDWVINGLARWVGEEFGGRGPRSLGRGALCPAASRCDMAYSAFVESRPVSDHSALRRIYMLNSLSDLLRVVSYQDLSPFKRLWAGVAAWQVACRLGFK